MSIDDHYIISMIKEGVMSQPEKPLSRWIIDNFAGLSGTSAQEIALRAKVDHRLPICQLTEEMCRKSQEFFRICGMLC